MTHPAWIVAMFAAAFAILFLLAMLDESREREREHLRATHLETERDELLDTTRQLVEELHQARVSRGLADQQLAHAIVDGRCPNYLACTETHRELERARNALMAEQKVGGE